MAKLQLTELKSVLNIELPGRRKRRMRRCRLDEDGGTRLAVITSECKSVSNTISLIGVWNNVVAGKGATQ